MEKATVADSQVADKRVQAFDGVSRFLSLDVFRGITICLMIIVNTPGKGATIYSYLIHAPWLGFTLADLVVPSFLFAVGNAMSFSNKKLETLGTTDFFLKVGKRTLLIFLIGYLMYWFPFFQQSPYGGLILKPISETRIMGVLQRIALCYFFAAIIVRYFSQRTSLIIAGLILLCYWGALYLFGDRAQELSIGGNAITKLDVLLLGETHVYKRDIIPFDPEGILSTIPAIVNVLAGYWVGIFIQQNRNSFEHLTHIMIAGLILVTIALGWNLVFPISKKLWTSSFVLYTVGIDILILSILIYLIEIRNWKYGVDFFNVFGKNPLFIYLLSEVVYIMLMLIKLPSGLSIFEWISTVFQSIVRGPLGSLTTAIAFMMFCWFVGWWLDKKRIYIRI
jgi:predicted acyltransferase